MAKKKSAGGATASRKGDRREVLEQMRREQQRSEKKRTYAIIAVSAVIALVIIGLPLWQVVQDSRTQDRLGAEGLTGIGASADACDEVVTKPGSGQSDHRPAGQPIFYDAAPPATGPHYAAPAPMARKFYTAQDRPELGNLVHNLEHGYTVLWYDESVAEDDEMLDQVRAIAGQFPSTSDPEHKFIAAPWTADDGPEFPDGKRVALTHWSVNGGEPGEDGELQHTGVWQYCDAPSGEAVADFMEQYPFTDSPEPNAA